MAKYTKKKKQKTEDEYNPENSLDQFNFKKIELGSYSDSK